MKRCPECGRDYNDDSLSFCLDDGSDLLFGPAAVDEPTAILSAEDVPGEHATRSLRQLPITGAPSFESGTHTASRKNSLLAGVAGIVLVTALGLGSYLYYGRDPAKQIESIAVMPFANDSGNAELDYLSDGMTETLIKGLSNLQSLDVKPRSAVFRYKGKDVDLATLGRELKVQAILNGRVVQRGDQLGLSLELVDIERNSVIWTERYERNSSDIVSLQSEIARDVSTKLKTRLTSAEVATVARTYTTDPEAYRLYLKGKYQNARYNEEGYRMAIEYFRQAIAIDPGYALAYLGIADAYNIAADWYLAPADSLPKSSAAARRALELDETLADAHVLLSINAFWHQWDWAAVEAEMQRAAELEPSYAAHGEYGIYLAATGRFEQAIAAQESRVRRWPLDPVVSNDLEWIYLLTGRFDQAIAQTRKTLELDQNFWQSYQIAGLAHERKGQFNEAVAALEKARSLDASPSILGSLGYVYAVSGRRVESEKILVELKGLMAQRYVSPYSIAVVYAGLNQKDAAFEWLDRAYAARSSAMALLAVDTVFDNLRPDPRFQELLKRMNLPPRI